MAKMTEEEVIRELSYIADEMPSMECGDWKEAIYMAIKAIEILNKIRAEIEQNADRLKDSLYGDGLRHALEIIDKYKAESEEI